MEYAPRHPDDPTLKGMLVWSVGLHALLAASIVAAAMYAPRTQDWGGPGGGQAVQVGVVSKLEGVPLPKPETVTNSRVVDETKALYQTPPQPPKPIVKPLQALPIPKFEKEKQPKYQTRPSRILEDKTPPPPNAVTSTVGGGAPSIPYSQPNPAATQFNVSGGTTGGINFSGPGGGDFGSKYPWFVEAVRNRVSGNWLQTSVDPSIRAAPRAVVDFQILRDGTITNIQIIKSSGFASVDDSARRAILGSSPVSRLPNDFSGSVVNVEFWFDFRR